MSKVPPRYDEEAAEKLWETVGRHDYDGPKMTMKSVVKWAGEDDPHGYAVYRASSIPKLVKDNWDKGDRGLGQIVHYLLNGTVKKTGKGSTEYYIFQEDTCRWDKVEEGWVKNVASKVLEGMLRDVDLLISTQAAQLCIGVVGEGEKEEQEDSRSKADLDAKKKKVATLINYVMSYRGVTNAMAFAGPLLMDETFEQRLDSNRHLIGIKGRSVVDLRTGQKRQRVAEDMVHNELDVAYGGDHVTNEADATGAEWMHRIVEKIMGGDEAMASEPQIVRVPRVMVDTLCERQLHDNVEMHCLHEIVDALTVALERFNGDSDTHSKFHTIKQDLETAISNTQASCSKMRILLRNKMMKKELVKVAWAPERHIPWCLDEEEKDGLDVQ
eukprot:gene29033-biopygen32908